MVMMREEDIETAIKVVIVGNGAVGKSSMIQMYCKGIFTKDYKKTIGVDFLERQLTCEGEDVRLMLWDTAGQEEFDAITKAYYRGAQACVLVFSTTDRASFEAVESWRKKVESEVGEIPTVLVQNKWDLADQASVTEEEAEALAKRNRLRFYRVSVKENLRVDDVFHYLGERYLAQVHTALQEEQDHLQHHKIGGGMSSQGPNNSIFTGAGPGGGGNNNVLHPSGAAGFNHRHYAGRSSSNGTIQLHPGGGGGGGLGRPGRYKRGAHRSMHKSTMAKCSLV